MIFYLPPPLFGTQSNYLIVQRQIEPLLYFGAIKSTSPSLRMVLCARRQWRVKSCESHPHTGSPGVNVCSQPLIIRARQHVASAPLCLSPVGFAAIDRLCRFIWENYGHIRVYTKGLCMVFRRKWRRLYEWILNADSRGRSVYWLSSVPGFSGTVTDCIIGIPVAAASFITSKIKIYPQLYVKCAFVDIIIIIVIWYHKDQ